MVLDHVPQLPDGALVLLVGPPAAGKSTLAGALVRAGAVEADDVLSTDAYREALTGDAADTSADRRMWVQLRADLSARMAAGRSTVVDATNLFPRRRARHIRVAREHGRPVVAIRVAAPLAELLARNDARDRVVPPGGLVGMATAMAERASVEQLLAEGMDRVLETRAVLQSFA